MSAQFKPGDRVRVINSFPHAMREGDTGSVTDRRGPVVDYRGDNGRMVYGVRADRFEKVEPEWVVGQQVSGDDYARLPVGSVVEMFDDLGKSVGNPRWTKQGNGLWTYLANVTGTNLAETGKERTLTHLPDATEGEDKATEVVTPVERVLHINGTGEDDVGAACGHELATGPGANPKHVGHSRSSFIGWMAGGGRGLSPTTDVCADCVALAGEPEDKADLYVEPEPLADWERALPDEVDIENTVSINTLDREEIHRLCRAFPPDWSLVEEDGSVESETINAVQAALREFANPTPVTVEPMGLGAVVEADAPAVLATAFVRTGLDESHPWCMGTTRAYYSWAELKNPRVLSEGWTDGGVS